MVIHTKKKAKLHTVRSRRIRVKGRNVLTVERGHRTRRAYIRPVKNPAAQNRTQPPAKEMAPKRSVVQSTSETARNEQKKPNHTGQKQNLRREIKTSQPKSRQGDARQEQSAYRDETQQKVRIYQKTQYQPRQVSPEQKIRKTDTAITLAAAAVSSKTAEQPDGGEEIKDAANVSYQLTNPLLAAGSKGAQYLKEKTLEERKRRIKVVEQRKTIDRIKHAGRKNLNDSDYSIHTNQFSGDDSREDAVSEQKQNLADAKRTYRYYTHKKYKQQNKKRVVKGKSRNTNIPTESSHTPNIHTTTSDYRASREITRQDAAVVTRKRKIRQYVNQLAVENRKSEIIVKKVKEQAAKKLSLWIKSIAPKVGGMLAAVVLILAVVALPTLSMVTIIYNSPLAIFFPPVEEGDMVQPVIEGYEQEFHRTVEELASTHPGHDEGELVYVDYEGTGGAPSNLYDMIAVYMVKYGVGETATIVNDISRAWMKQIVDDMCTYTTSTRIETYPDGEGGSYTITILCVNVTLKSYRDMIPVYDFDENEIELLETIMNPENLAMLGGTAGGAPGVTVQSLLTTAEIEAILQNVTNPTQRTACYFALSKVGYPYSQDYRDSGDYYDCSSLAFYAWKAAGKNISYQGLNSAASEAQGLEAAGKVVEYSEMQPGDLIFYSYEVNNRYKNISHVAIYIGNGKVVEAKGTNYGVIYGNVPNQGKIVTICRP